MFSYLFELLQLNNILKLYFKVVFMYLANEEQAADLVS